MNIKYLRIVVIIILLLIFFLGLYLYSSGRLEAFTQQSTDPAISSECPDMLIQQGTKILLYNSKQPAKDGINPLVFSKMEDYIEFNKDKNCPLLFLKLSSNTQNKDVYTVSSSGTHDTGIQNYPPLENYNARAGNNFMGGNSSGTQFNKGQYAGFDARGFDVGRFTALDAIHTQGEHLPISDNPMDPNWGGTDYTERIIQSGRYDENNVYVPITSKPL